MTRAGELVVARVQGRKPVQQLEDVSVAGEALATHMRNRARRTLTPRAHTTEYLRGWHSAGTNNSFGGLVLAVASAWPVVDDAEHG
jgi:hypothetical protein